MEFHFHVHFLQHDNNRDIYHDDYLRYVLALTHHVLYYDCDFSYNHFDYSHLIQ